MLDLKFIRENPDQVRKGLESKNTRLNLDELLALDKERRAFIQEADQLKSARNQANDQVVRLKKENPQAAEKLIAEFKAISQKIKEIDGLVGEMSLKIDKFMYLIPNIPHPDVPTSSDASGNKVIKEWGSARGFDFKAMDHLELGAKLGWLSMERGVKVSGAGFPVYQGMGARLQRGLINFMLDLHVNKHGYQEVWPPSLVNRTTMTGTGQLPKFEEDMYRLAAEDYFLIPTAEVPVTNLLRDEVIDEKDLPVKLTAYSPCFRREAGSYGKDTKGLSRLHQFDKVELVKFVKPEDGDRELESLVTDATEVLELLGLHYRVVLLSSGDMSFSAAKCYDLEIWAPATQRWFEVSSCSLFTDFQARRINIKYRSAETKKTELVYTLNGSGVALPRLVLCLLETYQTREGAVAFPEVLQKYLS